MQPKKEADEGDQYSNASNNQRGQKDGSPRYGKNPPQVPERKTDEGCGARCERLISAMWRRGELWLLPVLEYGNHEGSVGQSRSARAVPVLP